MLDEIVLDIHRAVRFIRCNAETYDIDKNRIGIAGASSVGYLSCMIGMAGKEGDENSNDPVGRCSGSEHCGPFVVNC